MLCSVLSSEMTFSAVGACAVSAVYEGSSGVNTADADCFLTRAVPLNKPSRGELGQNHCCGALMRSTQYTQQPIHNAEKNDRLKVCYSGCLLILILFLLAHCLTCILYTLARLFGSWLLYCLQMTGCHFNDMLLKLFQINNDVWDRSGNVLSTS
jgi:hypothetical protein